MTTVTADDAHGHGHDHPAFLQHHFDTPEQQEASSKMGMWLFLSTEILMFSGLFLAYAICRLLYPDMMLAAHEHLNVPLGSVNTVVLLFSSLTVALAVRGAQVGNIRAVKINLIITILCACTFMVVKYFEYSAKIDHGMLPGKFLYTAGEPFPGGPQLFFGIYFAMTGLHGIHVLIGIGVLSWIYRRASRGDFSPAYYTPLENTALYWHLVDLVWIFLFPLLYLVK